MHDQSIFCINNIVQVPHTFSEDGSLRYGDAVVIAHKQTCGSVACDPFSTAGFESNEFAASVCEASDCMARNTFIIQRADGGDDSADGGIVAWGVPFRLQANPSLRVDAKSGMLQGEYLTAERARRSNTRRDSLGPFERPVGGTTSYLASSAKRCSLIVSNTP